MSAKYELHILNSHISSLCMLDTHKNAVNCITLHETNLDIAYLELLKGFYTKIIPKLTCYILFV